MQLHTKENTIKIQLTINNFELDIFFKEDIQKITVDYIKKH
jgi:hypothetical protein